MYQKLNFDSLTKSQKLSIKALEVLLNTCFYKSKYSINIFILFYFIILKSLIVYSFLQ